MRTYSRRERILLGIVTMGLFGPENAVLTFWIVTDSRFRTVPFVLAVLGGSMVVGVFGKIALTGRSSPYWERPVLGTSARSEDTTDDLARQAE